MRLLAPLLLMFGLAACGGNPQPAGERSVVSAPSVVASPAAVASAVPAQPPGGDVAVDSPDAAAAEVGAVDYACAVDADCAVKDIGNCCGYFPACVNKDSATFPEQVRAGCAARGESSICGFAEIRACRCDGGRCVAADGAVQ